MNQFLVLPKCKELEADKDNESKETKFYFGESSKTGFERGEAHRKDFASKSDDSNMFKHWSDIAMEDVMFGMTVLSSHPSAFHCQVSESVLIFRNQNNLNSKSEGVARCIIPRLSFLIGERTEKEEDEEQESIDLQKELDTGRQKRTRKGRSNYAPMSKKTKLNIINDSHDDVDESIRDSTSMAPPNFGVF